MLSRKEIEQLFLSAKTAVVTQLKYDRGNLTFNLTVDGTMYQATTKITELSQLRNPRLVGQPWQDDPTWLEEEYKRHGSFQKIADAHKLSKSKYFSMVNYAKKNLGWRISLVFKLKRREFIKRYFGVPPKDRPSLRSVARELDVPATTASLWKADYERGKRDEKFTEEELRLAADLEDVVFPRSFVAKRSRRKKD